MPPYEADQLPQEATLKFIRVGQKVVLGLQDEDRRHSEIVVDEGLATWNQIQKLKTNDPTQADGGLLLIDRETHTILIQDESISLGLPVDYFARLVTLEALEQQSPDWAVDLDQGNPFIFPPSYPIS